MKIIFRTLLLLACLGLTLPAQAQMSDALKEEFHDAEQYGLVIVENLSQLRGALHDEATRVISFQSFGETLDEESQKELLEWVRSGKSVWFYDARLADKFGMRPIFLKEQQFRHKPEKGVLGGKKRHGFATVALSLGSHVVQTGVGQVTLFLPEIPDQDEEEMTYGAVEVAGDTKALLQFALDSPALIACRREGKGFIVFKTLLWNEPLSGDRFQMNLLEYSAGFQVPGPAGVGKVGSPPGPDAEYVEGEPVEPVSARSEKGSVEAAQGNNVVAQPIEGKGADTTVKVPVERVGDWMLELQDGTTVSGEYEGEQVEFETGTSSLKLKPDQVESLTFGSSMSLDKIVTVQGKQKSGLLLSTPIRFRTSRGVEEFEKEDVVRLFRAPLESPETKEK